MLKSNWSVLLIGISLIISTSCKHEPDDHFVPDPIDTTDIITCHPDTSYFVNDVLPIFQSSCALSGCHDAATAQDGIILSSYNDIINSGELEPGNASDSDIYEKITDSDPDDRMPPPPLAPLNQEQIATIRDWINQGARNNSCQAECDTTEFGFAAVIQPLINNTCRGCHNTALPSGGVNLETHAGIASVAADGRLLGVISHATGYPPMPQNGNKLPECNITQVRKWIEAGSPNN